MKLSELKQYAPLPEDCRAAIEETLLHIGEEKVQRRKPLVSILVAALLVIILAATAYAVANRAGMVDFLGNWSESFSLERFTHDPTGGESPMRGTVGDYEIEISEVLGDGRAYLVNAIVSLRPGVEGELMMRFVGGDEMEIPTDGSGGRVHLVDCTMVAESIALDGMDFITNEDGSISISGVPSVDPLAAESELVCTFSFVDGMPGEVVTKEDITEATMTMSLSGAEALSRRQLAEPVPIGETGMVIDVLFAKQVEDAIYIRMLFTYPGGAGVDYMMPMSGPYSDGLRLTLCGEDGEALPLLEDSMSHYARLSYMYPVGVNQYGVDWQLALEEMPEALWLDVRDGKWKDKQFGQTALPLKAWDIEAEGYAFPEEMGWYPMQRMADQDMIDAMDVSYVEAYAILQNPHGEGVAIHAAPDEASEVIATYYNGNFGVLFGHIGEWSYATVERHGIMYVGGYVRTDELAFGEGLPETVQSDIRRAEVLAEETLVRFHPDEEATIVAPIGPEDVVYVAAEVDGWYFVSTETEQYMVMGYVPMEALRLTEESEMPTIWQMMRAAEIPKTEWVEEIPEEDWVDLNVPEDELEALGGWG